MAKYLLEQKNIITHDPNIEKHEETHFGWMRLVGLRHIGKKLGWHPSTKDFRLWFFYAWIHSDPHLLLPNSAPTSALAGLRWLYFQLIHPPTHQGKYFSSLIWSRPQDQSCPFLWVGPKKSFRFNVFCWVRTLPKEKKERQTRRCFYFYLIPGIENWPKVQGFGLG